MDSDFNFLENPELYIDLNHRRKYQYLSFIDDLSISFFPSAHYIYII